MSERHHCESGAAGQDQQSASSDIAPASCQRTQDDGRDAEGTHCEAHTCLISQQPVVGKYGSCGDQNARGRKIQQINGRQHQEWERQQAIVVVRIHA